MKKSKFIEAQIAFILRQGEEGRKAQRCLPQGRDSEATYWVRDEATALARGREWQTDSRPVAREGDAPGRDPPKPLKPALRGTMALNICSVRLTTTTFTWTGSVGSVPASRCLRWMWSSRGG